MSQAVAVRKRCCAGIDLFVMPCAHEVAELVSERVVASRTIVVDDGKPVEGLAMIASAKPQ